MESKDHPGPVLHLSEPNKSIHTSENSEIRYKTLLHGCKQCPEKRYVSPDNNNPHALSVRNHVAEEHPDMCFLQLTRIWGHRLHYRNGTIEDIPLLDSGDTSRPSHHADDGIADPLHLVARYLMEESGSEGPAGTRYGNPLEPEFHVDARQRSGQPDIGVLAQRPQSTPSQELQQQHCYSDPTNYADLPASFTDFLYEPGLNLNPQFDVSYYQPYDLNESIRHEDPGHHRRAPINDQFDNATNASIGAPDDLLDMRVDSIGQDCTTRLHQSANNDHESKLPGRLQTPEKKTTIANTPGSYSSQLSSSKRNGRSRTGKLAHGGSSSPNSPTPRRGKQLNNSSKRRKSTSTSYQPILVHPSVPEMGPKNDVYDSVGEAQVPARRPNIVDSVPIFCVVSGPTVFPPVPFKEIHHLDRAALTGEHGEHVAMMSRVAFFGHNADHPTHPRSREAQLLDMVNYLRLQRDWLQASKR